MSKSPFPKGYDPAKAIRKYWARKRAEEEAKEKGWSDKRAREAGDKAAEATN